MDNFASLVTQYPSAFCFCDTTAPLQSPLWVFTKSAATMTNVSNWSTIFTISNVLKVNSPPICVISIYSPFHLYEGCRQVYLPTPILTTTPTPTTTLTLLLPLPLLGREASTCLLPFFAIHRGISYLPPRCVGGATRTPLVSRGRGRGR